MDSYAELRAFIDKVRAAVALALGRQSTVSSNIQQTTFNSGSGATITKQGAAFATSFATSVRLYVSATGVTSGSGDIVTLNVVQDGAVISAAPTASVNSGTPGKLFAIDQEWIVTGLVPGQSHTYGFQVADSSAGTITLSAAPGGYVQVEEK